MTRPSTLALVAFTSSALLSGVAIADAVQLGLHLHRPLDLSNAPPALIGVVCALHSLVFAALAAVLWQFTRPPYNTGRTARWALRATAAADAVLAIIYAYGTLTKGAFPPALEAVAGSAFLIMFVAGAVGGTALLRHPGRRWAGALLLAPVPVLAIITLAAALGWHGAHPAYAEVFAYFGAALLAVPSTFTTSPPAPTPDRQHDSTGSAPRK
jgi:hypothetical protein